MASGNPPTFGLWYDFRQRLPGLSHEQALKSMRLFASEVAPRVRETVEAA